MDLPGISFGPSTLIHRLYQQAPPSRVILKPTQIAIIDHERKRTLVMRKDGLPDAVVWNPWNKKAKSIPDFGDDDHKRTLCVGAANVEKPITLKPGEEWIGRLELSLVASSYCSGQLDPQKFLRG